MANYTVVELGAPAPTNGTRAYCLNENGTAGGETYLYPWGTGVSAILWTTGIPEILDSLPHGMISGISDAGDAVGAAHTNDSYNEQPFLYKAGAVSDLTPKLGLGSHPTGINNAGWMCGYRMGLPQGTRAYIYDVNAQGGPSYLDPPAGFGTSSGTAINQAGDVVGIFTDGPPSRGFLFSGGQLTDLGEASSVFDASDSGLIVGSKWNPAAQGAVAVIYDRNAASPQFEEIGILPGRKGSNAFGVNNLGHVVGNSYTGIVGSAFLYSNGQMSDLNDLIPPNSGWQLETASDINDAGQIMGYGTLNGEHRGFLLNPPGFPVPPKAKDFSKYMAVWLMLFGGVTKGGSGWGLLPGGGLVPIPVDPEWWYRLSPAKQDLLIGLAMSELASLIGESRSRKDAKRQASALIEKAVAALKKESVEVKTKEEA